MDAITKGGETKKLGEGMFTPTRLDLAAQLVQNKLAPSAALAVKWAQTKADKEGKKKLYGKEFILSEELAGSLYPMYIGTVNELWKDQPETVSAFLTAYAFLGGGVSTYDSKKDVASIYAKPETAQMIKDFKSGGTSEIGKDTFAVSLTEDELAQLNTNYRKKESEILDLYSATKPSMDDKKMFPEKFNKVTENQLEEARLEAVKKGTPEAQLDEESKRIAIEKKKREKISDDISELATLGKNAAAYEYFKSLGKRIPPTIEDAVKEYEKKLSSLQKQLDR